MISDFGKVRKKRYREVTCKLQVKYERRKEHNPRQKRERICAQGFFHPLPKKKRKSKIKKAVLKKKPVPPPLKDVVRASPFAVPPAQQSRSITAALAFLIGCVTLMMTGFAVILPVFPQRLQALGLGPEMLALMEGAFGLGMFLFSTPMGTWSGHIGRKPILFISLPGFIVTNLLLSFYNVPHLYITF